MRLNYRLLSTALLVCPSLASASPQGNDEPFLSTNLAAITYYSTQWVFVDAFRQARPWLAQNVDDAEWDTGQHLELNDNGWPLLAPGQAAGTLMFRGIDGRYPAGDYTCFYDGRGRLEFGFDGEIREVGTGFVSVRVDPSDNGIYLKVVESDPADPLRNIRMIMPGFEDSYETQPFHPLFLDQARGHKTLRFMDWLRTNETVNTNWSERTQRDWYSQAVESGVAYEWMMELCDEVDANLWVCVPHLATDDYVRDLAQLLNDHFDPSLKVYVEHSNEVWNTRFPQTEHAIERGTALGLSSNPSKAGLLYHSQRSVEIFDIFESKFGSTDRLVRVLATQAAKRSSGELVMDHQNAYQSADALAIAPYFGDALGNPDNAPITVNLGVDAILDGAQASLPVVAERVSGNKLEAAQRGLDLIAYEAGQHLVGGGPWVENQTLANLFFAANRHERMLDIYQEYLALWRNLGGGEMVHFTSVKAFNKFGSWGTLEYLDQPAAEAPKFRALREAIHANCPEPYSYCSGSSNSTGSSAEMHFSGSQSVALLDFMIEINHLPPGAIGGIFYGLEQEETPFGGGTICIGAGDRTIVRLGPPTTANSNGSVKVEIDSSFETHPLGALRAGTRWNFQYFYVEPGFGGRVNLSSNALSVRFCP